MFSVYITHTLDKDQSRITGHWVIGWTGGIADILSRIIDHGHSDGEGASHSPVPNIHCHSGTVTILLILESENMYIMVLLDGVLAMVLFLVVVGAVCLNQSNTTEDSHGSSC